jgi:23S rRNA pseudouridine1911/1915/1917 synthase
MLEVFKFQISHENHRKRFEDFLFEEFTTLSKLYLRDVLKNKKCLVNGVAKDRGFKLQTNDLIELELNIDDVRLMQAEDIPLEILFEDEEIIVVNKPAEMLVHPTLGVRTGTLLNALSYHFNVRNKTSEHIRPGLTHRLDRKTSGLLVIAKTLRSNKILCQHFQKRIIEKEYSALVEGIIQEDEGKIEAPIGKFDGVRRWDVNADGKHAETHFRVIERKNDTTLLELKPITGRTNQLRIHCNYIGHPILGDDIYNGREYPRMCLHAQKLKFWHPNGNRYMEFETKVDFYSYDKEAIHTARV